jgi:hypothetical protein
MEARAVAPNLSTLTGRSFETRILSTWLPLSVIGAAVLGFESWLGPKGAYYALAILPTFPVFFAVVFLIRHPVGVLKTFILFLVPYLSLEWSAEIYYLWHWVNFVEDPVVPSLADYCWLASYFFLITGCWLVASANRGLRLCAKDAFVHGVWLVTAVVILFWLGGSVIASDRTTTEAVVMVLYPFFDAVVISLLLIIRSRHRSETVRAFWLIVLIASLSVLGGDVMWLLSRSTAGDGEAMAKVGDAFYLLAYLLDVVAVWVAFRVERVHASESRSAEAVASVRRALSTGGVNSLASVPIVVMLALIFVAEKGVEHALMPMVHAGPLPLLAMSGIVAFGLKAAFWKWEKKLDAVAMYRDEFRKRLQDNCELSHVEMAFLDRLRIALRIRAADARAIEGRILQDKEDELRARLDRLQRETLERRSAEEWQATRSAWLSSIHQLSNQLDSELGSARSLDSWLAKQQVDGTNGIPSVN